MSRLVKALAIALVTSASAQSATARAVVTANGCQLTAHVNLWPGLSMTPSSGTFGTYTIDALGKKHQLPGTLDCQGLAGGAQITGPGTITIDGTYGTGALRSLQGGDTCVEGSGFATVQATVPTTAGPQTIYGTINLATIAATGVGLGQLSGGVWTAAPFQFTPDQGQDCTSVPITGLSVTGVPINLSAPSVGAPRTRAQRHH